MERRRAVTEARRQATRRRRATRRSRCQVCISTPGPRTCFHMNVEDPNHDRRTCQTEFVIYRTSLTFSTKRQVTGAGPRVRQPGLFLRARTTRTDALRDAVNSIGENCLNRLIMMTYPSRLA
jgi:hypothetical protein